MMNQDNQSYQFEEKTGRLVSVTEASVEQKNQKMNRMEKLGTFLSNVILSDGVESNIDSNDTNDIEKENFNQVQENRNTEEEFSYWDYTGDTYTGIYPPKDSVNRIWIPTDEVSETKIDENTSRIDPVWEQITFNFLNVVNRAHYEDVVIPVGENSVVSVYETQINAFKEENAVTNFDFTGSIIGVPEKLVGGTFVEVENLDDQSLVAEELVFPLLKEEKVVGYINGKAVVMGITQNISEKMLQSDRQEEGTYES